MLAAKLAYGQLWFTSMIERWNSARTGERIPALVLGVCSEPTCSGPIPDNRNGRFCSDKCYRLYHKRAVTRGFRVYEPIMRWITNPRPSHQKGAKNPRNPHLGDLTDLAREFAREDRELREQANARQTQAAASPEASAAGQMASDAAD
jgi:hypothetical protein